MPNTPNTSFIPRRGPAKRSHQNASRQVYVFTGISYVLFFATLIMTAGLFLYERHVTTQLEAEISALDSAISSFSDADMELVRELDLRLMQTRNRLDNAVSVVSIFEALESATVKSAQLIDFTLLRVADTEYSLKASVITDTFDSALFQRTLFGRNDVFESVAINDLVIGASEVEEGSAAAAEDVISFSAELKVPLSAIPYVPGDAAATQEITPQTVTSPDETEPSLASSTNPNSL